jgi:hypothetical protein
MKFSTIRALSYDHTYSTWRFRGLIEKISRNKGVGEDTVRVNHTHTLTYHYMRDNQKFQIEFPLVIDQKLSMNFFQSFLLYSNFNHVVWWFLLSFYI